jgi:hypothetical protein
MSTTVTKSRKLDRESAAKEHYIVMLENSEMRLKMDERIIKELEELLSMNNVEFDPAEDYPIEEITEPKYSALYRKAKYLACRRREDIAENRVKMLRNAWIAFVKECINSQRGYKV